MLTVKQINDFMNSYPAYKSSLTGSSLVVSDETYAELVIADLVKYLNGPNGQVELVKYSDLYEQ